jgi:hypothetical protein
MPTNPEADVNISAHVINDPNYKNNAPTTSTSELGENTPRDYGSDQIEVNTGQLQRDINDGKLSDVSIIPNQQIRDQLQSKVDTAQNRYNENPSKTNTRALEKAKRNFNNASQDNECLLVGCIPKDYIKGGQ